MAAVAAASGMLLTAQFPLPSAPIIALILLHVVTHRSDDGTVCVRHQLSQQESNTHAHTTHLCACLHWSSTRDVVHKNRISRIVAIVVWQLDQAATGRHTKLPGNEISLCLFIIVVQTHGVVGLDWEILRKGCNFETLAKSLRGLSLLGNSATAYVTAR